MLRNRCLAVFALALGSLLASSGAQAAAVTGEIRVLLMVVDSNQPIPRSLRHYENNQVTDVSWSDASTIQDFAFERSSSFAELFAEMSYGQLTVTGDTVLLSFPYDAASRTWRQWLDLADAQALSQGFDPAQYDRTLYILPHRPSDATVAGLALGTRGWCTAYNRLELGCIFHEFGHTIGFTHAAERLASGGGNGTGDDSDGVMGQGFNCHANVVNKHEVGWLTGNRLQTIDTAGSTSFGLAAQSAQADALQALEIVNDGANPVHGVVDTFVSYRDTGGFDGQLSNGLPDLHGDAVFDAVLIHQKNRQYRADTLYVQALTAGETYAEHGVSVTVNDISGGTANVTVQRDPYLPVPHQASITPANIDTQAGRFHFYSVDISNQNDPALVSFDSFYDVSFSQIAPGWLVGWTSGFPKTVPPGQTRSFQMLVWSPSSAAPGVYPFTVSVTELDGDAGPYTVVAQATYTITSSDPDTGPPTAPTGLTGTGDGTTVSLDWNPSSDDIGVSGYLVYRESGTATGNYGLVGTPGATSYEDNGVPQAVAHRYLVRAYDAASNLSADSNVFEITLPDTLPPGAPLGLEASSVTEEAVAMSWGVAPDNVAVAGYEVLRDGFVLASPSATSFVDETVVEDTSYVYTVRAFDTALNVGPESDPLEVMTPDSEPPPDPVGVAVLGWKKGLSHTAPAGVDRALVFTAHVEDNDAVPNLLAVSYGGQPLTPVVSRAEGSGDYVYAAAFVLDEAGIAAANGSGFSVSWAEAPDRVGYASGFLEHVDQASPVGASAGAGVASGKTVSTGPLPTLFGDRVVSAGTSGSKGRYSVNGGFSEEIELSIRSADGVVGSKSASGGAEAASVTHSKRQAQVVLGFVMQAASP